MKKLPRTFYIFAALTLFSFIATVLLKKVRGLSPATLMALEGKAVAEGARLLFVVGSDKEELFRKLIKTAETSSGLSGLKISYPHDESVFPPDFITPTFLWEDERTNANFWLIEIGITGFDRIFTLTSSPRLPPPVIDSICLQKKSPLPKRTKAKNWTPGDDVWNAIKEKAREQWVEIRITGFHNKNIRSALSRDSIRIQISGDSVAAPIFYRDVPIMPSVNESGDIQPLAESAQRLIKWRLRDVSRRQSRVVMEQISSCANCHSFSADGSTLGMDIDGPQGDKGAYAFMPLSREMVVTRKDLISWNYDFQQKIKGGKTLGFMSRVSPSGRYVITTVNEKLYVVNYLNYKFLQVFFPTRGVLAWYDKATGDIRTLPGADNPDYVHCNAVWSPDEKFIIFARARAKEPYKKGQKTPVKANDPEETQIQYDLYRIPFNNGRGGKPVPVRGASNNNTSNSFPKVSPDGKYIVFVKCRNGQLLRPDSRLWIVPVLGGTAREMKCNTERMNSWHSFSPNGRWMVFSSKANTYYTQMFLTHMDENGNDTPPILIPNSTAANRAVNIPEFVNISFRGLQHIRVPAVDHFKYLDDSRAYLMANKPLEAVSELQKALEVEKQDKKFRSQVYVMLGLMEDNPQKGAGLIEKAIREDPNNGEARFNQAIMYQRVGEEKKAIAAFEKVLQLNPDDPWTMGRMAGIYMLSEDPNVRDTEKAVRYAEKANEITYYRKTALLKTLARAYSQTGRFEDAAKTAGMALRFAGEKGERKETYFLLKEKEHYEAGGHFSGFIYKNN